MDNNPNIQAPVNTSPAAPQAAPAQMVTNGGNKKLWFIVGLVIVVLILVAGGIYWYITTQQKAPSTTKQPAPSPADQTNVDTLEKDLEASSLDDLDKEFVLVDTDLQGL